MDHDTETPVLLDVTGLKCPFPVLQARKALRVLPAGAVLAIRSTDPRSSEDFQALCQEHGHTLLEAAQAADGIFNFRIRRSDTDPT